MFTNVQRAQCAVCVLLGGSGRRVPQPPAPRRIPMLFKPWSATTTQALGQDQAEAAPARA